jgi:hypothetical protein
MPVDQNRFTFEQLNAALNAANRPIQCVVRKPDGSYQTSIHSGHADRAKAFVCGFGWTIPLSIEDAMANGGLTHLLTSMTQESLLD